MPKGFCYIENCLNYPSIVCNCRSGQIFICHKHAENHLKLEGKHFYTLYSEISEQTRKSTLKIFYKINSDLKQYKMKIIEEESTFINKISEVAKKVLKKLNDYHNKVNEILSAINQLKQIDNTKSPSFIESLLLKSKKYVWGPSAIRSPRLIMHSIDSSLIKKSINLEPFSPNFCYGDYSEISTSLLKFVKSWDLNIFDVKNFDITKNEIQISEFLDKGGAQCLLPDGSLFYYNDSYVSFIIDPLNKIKRIPFFRSAQYSGSIYGNGCVFLFGGRKFNSEKYDLKRNKWILLPRFPMHLFDATTCALFKNYILIGGMQSKKILIFDLDINSYSTISITSIGETSKAFFVRKEKIFLLTFSKLIYENKGDLINWENLGKCPLLQAYEHVISHHIYYQGKYYFADYFCIYSFNLKQKKLDVVVPLK